MFENKLESPQIEQQEEDQGYQEVETQKQALYNALIEEAHGDTRAKREKYIEILSFHELVVFQYGDELIKEHPNLSDNQRIAVRLGLMLHDSGKIEAELLKHHEQSSINAEKILRQLQKQGHKIEGLEINEEIIEKTKQAIERHMNHPFLIAMNGGRFSEPQDDVDKIVFDADILANIGAKNVGFRLGLEANMLKDSKAAEESRISQLEAAFDNVMAEVRTLDSVVLTDPGKKRAKELIQNMEIVMANLIKKDEHGENALQGIQQEFSDEQGNFSLETIKEKGGFSLIKERLNEEILKAGQDAVDEKILNNFKI